MGCVLYVGCVTNLHATVMISFCIYIYKKKKWSSQLMVFEQLTLGVIRKSRSLEFC
jgi:hypothetical protein